MELDKETRFFLKKLEFDYGKKKAIRELKKISKKISWLKGWPENKIAFWNGEAFMWGSKISQRKRELIKKELGFLGRGRNLDLGCGSYSYVKSVGFDISEKMLLLNENLNEKVVGDLEEELLFGDEEFDSVSMVFVLDYVNDYLGLLKEAARVLKGKGNLVIVQPINKVDKWHRQKAVNCFDFEKWKVILGEAGFKFRFYEKESLGFFKCIKKT